jgi:peptide/nickel transport system ATP-binding protein
MANESHTLPDPVTDSLLKVSSLRTQFHTHRGIVHAVNGVSFSVEEGELVGLVGETGCGKSVTARSIIGLIRPPGQIVDGEIQFDGVDLRSVGKRGMRRLRGTDISFVPQNPWGALNPILSIERQFRNMIKAHRKATNHECMNLAEEILTKVGIGDRDRVLAGYAHQLSGGMAQRVVIALALVLNPRLVIADEPTTGLDVTVQRQILDLIMEVLERDQRAMLLVTHDLGIVAQYCHKVIVMYAGKIVESGPVREVFKQPAHPYTKALLAAIPRVGQKLVHLGGTVPSLIDYPRGCPFHDRCVYVTDRCFAEEPVLRPLTATCHVACHVAEEVMSTVAHTA